MKGFIKDKWLHSDLFNAFESYGSIVSAKVSIDKFHASKGFGYVQFENSSEAEKAKSAVRVVINLIFYRCMVIYFQVERLYQSLSTIPNKEYHQLLPVKQPLG